MDKNQLLPAIERADTFLRGIAIPNLIALALCHQLPGTDFHTGTLIARSEERVTV